MVTVNKLSVIQVYLPNSKFLKPIIEAKASNIVDDPEACYISAMVEVEFPTLTADHVETFKFPTFIKTPYPLVDEDYFDLLMDELSMETTDRNELDDKLVMYSLENIDEITNNYIEFLPLDPDLARNFNEAIMEFVINHNGIEPDDIEWNF